MAKLIKTGICAVCGENRKLSFEHVPPRAAFNDKPIFIQTHDHLTSKDSKLYGKKIKGPKGMGDYTLCEQCNNNTGSWYGEAFSDFAHQGMQIINEFTEIPYAIKGTYRIKPLNVIKQIIAMFLSIDTSGHLRSQNNLVSFVLQKEMVGLPNKYKVFLYSNLCPNKRKMGYSIAYAGHPEIQKWSEINFKPFGYLLAEESGPAHEHMSDISKFGECNYDEIKNLLITTPLLRVQSPFIGTYS